MGAGTSMPKPARVWPRRAGFVPEPPLFDADAITRDVMSVVEREFADHPGSLAHFNWPVTRAQALVAP